MTLSDCVCCRSPERDRQAGRLPGVRQSVSLSGSPGTMHVLPGAVSRLRTLLQPRHVTRLLVGVTASCLLLLLLVSRPESQRPGRTQLGPPTEGRHRGRPISDLWATGLPEQRWFADDPQCRQYVTRFTLDHRLPLVYLVSLPRSGNTWTRYLLEAATGLFTCVGGPEYDQYRNVSNRNATRTPSQIWEVTRRGQNQWVDFGYLGELLNWTQGNTLVARSQTWPQPWTIAEAEDIYRSIQKPMAAFPADTRRRAVLIVRDPFLSFISWKKYDKTHSMLNEGDMAELFHGPVWSDFVIYYAHVWYELYARWLQSTDDVHIIHYHRLTRDTMTELKKLLLFLEVEPDPARLECLRRNLEGRVHNRKHGVVPNHATYPIRLRAEVWSHIHQLNWLLKDRGLEPLPLESYSFADEFLEIGV